jgi:dihydrofolate synthase/folylpolyglutamate synthase
VKTSNELQTWLVREYGSEKFNPGLERMCFALQHFGLLENPPKIITICGTNGKGQVSRTISYYLGHNSKKYCIWTSPHLISLNERFSSEEGPISDKELIECTQKLHDEVQKNNIGLTYYEFLFLVFCYWSHRREVEFLVLEVGLGGRLDAVNVFDADFVALTSISRDHQEFLGNRYELILKEKLGVLREKTQLFHGLSLNYLKERVKHPRQLTHLVLKNKDDDFSTYNQKIAKSVVEAILKQKLSLNVPDFSDRARAFDLPQNWQCYPSHNPDGIRKLFHLLRKRNYNIYECLYLSFSDRDNSDLSAMVNTIRLNKDMFKTIRLVHADLGFKSLSHEKRAWLKDISKFEECDWMSFIKGLKEKDRILFTGSNYFIGKFIADYQRN